MMLAEAMAIFFTSDTHFGDPRVLRLDRRPFKTVAEHDEALIATWNEAVAPQDEVWHLGDFGRGPAERIATLLATLNGRKHLIIGNNDGPASLAAAGWESVQHYREIVVDERALVLCHYPFRTWNNMGKRWIDLHGHSHGKLKKMSNQFDVGVDAWPYRPVALATILASRRRGATARG